MKPALVPKLPKYPKNWQALHLGKDLQAVAELKLAEPSRQMFGYHLVKLGSLSSQLALDNCPIQHKINVTSFDFNSPSVIAEPGWLPFASRSIDAFILAHELDFAQDPHQVLREVDRCMMPDGHVAILGFNPVSLPGCLKWTPFKHQNVLHDARFFSAHRVKDWLSLLGYQIVDEQFYIHSTLFFEKKIDLNSKWAKFASRYLPFMASVYLIVGKKREFPLSLIKPKWELKTRFATVGASIRSATTK
ncbi:class I SAM-dependent methyltransferase [Alteromonas sp. a30]|uniref:class I SAM-dependent methyltransferase n=1 Tax=Alteromonas sp. a30 TaxID=2730917 RepID=UPI00227E9940|nr:methyltransferase domain-containing protein [Alteromonas sp. a30]MCY7297007.1 methyltransferase domain-containing protein [Alteromonas sp. a30]